MGTAPKKIAILNGPNLNLLGSRETALYGTESFESFFKTLQKDNAPHLLDYVQSNEEGTLINHLHRFAQNFDGVIFNPAGYSHTSVAIADAIAAIQIPVVEVHISNIHAREEYRHNTLTGARCAGVITGFGLTGYRLALHYLLHHL